MQSAIFRRVRMLHTDLKQNCDPCRIDVLYGYAVGIKGWSYN